MRKRENTNYSSVPFLSDPKQKIKKKKKKKIKKLKDIDEHHKVLNDPLHVPIGPITKARSKKIKEALNGLIQEIWADSNTGRSKLGPKEDEGVINLIQAIEG